MQNRGNRQFLSNSISLTGSQEEPPIISSDIQPSGNLPKNLEVSEGKIKIGIEIDCTELVQNVLQKNRTLLYLLGLGKDGIEHSKNLINFPMYKFINLYIILLKKRRDDREFSRYELAREARISKGRYTKGSWGHLFKTIEEIGIIKKIGDKTRGSIYKVTQDGENQLKAILGITSNSPLIDL